MHVQPGLQSLVLLPRPKLQSGGADSAIHVKNVMPQRPFHQIILSLPDSPFSRSHCTVVVDICRVWEETSLRFLMDMIPLTSYSFAWHRQVCTEGDQAVVRQPFCRDQDGLAHHVHVPGTPKK